MAHMTLMLFILTFTHCSNGPDVLLRMKARVVFVLGVLYWLQLTTSWVYDHVIVDAAPSVLNTVFHN